ncbi:MAG TPA: hypothetical protein VIG74_04380 [Alphaproteobacteria bacterium]|jgi:hypothetical protein
MKHLAYGFLTAALVVFGAALIFMAASAAVERMERRECYEWQHEAIYNPTAIKGFEQWQVAQCRARGVTVEWPAQN